MNVYTDLFFKSINVTYSHDFEFDPKKNGHHDGKYKLFIFKNSKSVI